jgi:FkbM family methyltransferase
MMDSPFWHYNSTFDAQEVMHRYAVKNLSPQEGLLVNFLGVTIDPEILPQVLLPMAGLVEPVPIPANWHADIAEWGAALRAVDLAGSVFTVLELGCGWGCWINNMGAAARSVGKDIRLIGVEGDPRYTEFAHKALARNGFAEDDWTIINGIASGGSGTALFPRQEGGDMSWGLEPVFNATDDQKDEAVRTGAYHVLPMVPLYDIAKDHERIDLLHIDIQGGEAAFVSDCIEVMNEKVGYVVIGTHSRQIEGEIFDTLGGAGWMLEMERPAILLLTENGPVVTVDGLQGWRNRLLLG